MRSSLLLTLLLAAAASTIPAQATDSCAPSPAVQAALDQLPIRSPAETEWEFRQKDRAAFQELLTRFPSDLFVQRKYIQSMYRRTDKDQVIGEYKARHEQSPDDPKLAYLYGMALVGRRSAEAIKLYNAALSKSPGFPWPHLGLAGIYGSPVFQNNDEKLSHVKEFLMACPEALDGYEQLPSVDDKSMLTAYAPKLRVLLQARTDQDGIRGYTTLWAIEFKAHALPEYDALRKQVAEDLKRIRALNLENKRQWYTTLEEGYKLANDQKQSDWALEQRQRRLPYSWEQADMSKWHKDHKRPQTDEAADKKRAYYAELLKQTDLWLKERPKMPGIWGSRLTAMEHLEDTPAAEVEATADEYFKLLTSDAGPDGPGSYDYFTIARVLARKHLQPEKVVELATKGLAKVTEESAEPLYDTYATKEVLQDFTFYQSLDLLTGSGYQADGYIQLKQAEKAKITLARMEDELQASKRLAGDKAEFKKEYTIRLASWWALMARSAELEGHDQDAMAYYEDALLSRLEAQQTPETGVKDEVAENARRLWTKLGGTNDGWQLWYGRRADSLATVAGLTWEDANQPLPTFDLTDIKGKTWTLASLKGKVTFLNFWASW